MGEYAIQQVEYARVSTITALQKMIQTVENARAKSTAEGEITKARSISLITQAIDKLDPRSLSIIANSIAKVEIEVLKANMISKIAKIKISDPTATTTYPKKLPNLNPKCNFYI